MQSIQPKLKVSQPNDAHEQQADRVAASVMSTSVADAGTARDAIGANILQTKSADGAAPTVTGALASDIQSLNGSGKPLAESERNFFEPRLDADLSDVRIHDDARASGLASAVNARAFTVGRDIVFADGEYAPGTESGRRLVAHELTHVLQQSAAGNSSGAPVIQRTEENPTPEEVAAFSAAEIERALIGGYVWGFEAQYLNRLFGERRLDILHCRSNQLWRLVRLLRRSTTPETALLAWQPAFAGPTLQESVGTLIGRDTWEPLRCGEEDYPGRYRDYIGSQYDRTLVRVPMSLEEREATAAADEHPEVGEAASVSMMNLYRHMTDNPRDPRFHHYIVDAGVTELLARERAASGEAESGGTTTLPLEDRESGFHVILSDARHIALSLMTSDPNLLRELESLPDDEAMRFLELLGTQLTGLALQLMDSDPEFRREVEEALRQFREGVRRYRERHRRDTPPSLAPGRESGAT